MSGWKYALRVISGPERMLMCRLVTPTMPDPPWHDIARFSSSNDAERVLEALRRDSGVCDE